MADLEPEEDNEDPALVVYSLARKAPPLRLLLGALKTEEYPAELSVGIAGAATDEDLDDPLWENVVVRWTVPELHEVFFVTRYLPGADEEATAAIDMALKNVTNRTDSAGRLIVTDHLKRTQAVYVFDVQLPMLDEEDHVAWDALDVALRTLAQASEGLIYGVGDGYYDTDGEMLLDDEDLED